MSFRTDEPAEVRTHKKEFLGQMERLVPRGEWLKKIQPHDDQGERGGQALGPVTDTSENLYNMANMAANNGIIDQESDRSVRRQRATSV